MAEYRVTVVSGKGAVGKSAIVVTFVQGRWISRYEPTIEGIRIQQYNKNINLLKVESWCFCEHSILFHFSFSRSMSIPW